MEPRRSPGGVICRHRVDNGLCEGPESKTAHFEAFMGPLWATRETGTFEVFLEQHQERIQLQAASVRLQEASTTPWEAAPDFRLGYSDVLSHTGSKGRRQCSVIK